MKRNKIFSFRLYREGLRQLLLPGTVCAAVCAVATVLPAVLNLLAAARSIVYRNQPSISAATPVLFFLAYAGSVAMVFYVFSFLRRRSASDYYHSIPETRVCLCISFLAAVLTWLLLIILGTILLTYLSKAFVGQALNISFIPYLIGYFMAVSALSVGAALIGVCTSGTMLSSAVVTGLVAWLPRTMLMIAGSTLAESIRYGQFITTLDLGLLMDPTMNALTGSLFSGFAFERLMTSWRTIGYSLALALITMAVGVYLFKNRASETAEYPARNRFWQAAIRCLLTATVLIAAVAIMLNDPYGYQTESVWVLTILSVLVFFMYEIISTQRIKGLWRIAPQYIVSVALAGLFMLGTTLYIKTESVRCPGKEDIVSLSVFDISSDRYDYQKMMTDTIRVSDPELSKIAAQALETQLSDPTSVSTGGDWYRINTNKGSMVRYLGMDTETYARMTEIFMRDDAYRAAYRSLPLDSEIRVITDSDGRFTEQEYRMIWESFKAEAAALPDDIFGYVCGEMGYADKIAISEKETVHLDQPSERLYVYGYKGAVNFREVYRLTMCTPKTLALYYQIMNEYSGQTCAEVLRVLAKESLIYTQGSDKYPSYNITAQFFCRLGEERVASQMEIYQPSDFITREKDIELIRALLALNGPVDETSECFVCINVHSNEIPEVLIPEDKDVKWGMGGYPLRMAVGTTQEQVKALIELYKSE